MAFDTDVSDIRLSGFFHYSVSSILTFSSAGLANLDLKFESEHVSISGASLVITGPYYWRSLLMALHTPLVFVGLIGIGPSSWYFSYRCPWTYRASLLRSVLISLSGGDTDNPRTSRQIYSEELARIDAPAVGFCSSLARLALPRSGWMLPS